MWVMRRAPPPSVQQWGGQGGGERASGDAKLSRQSIISEALSFLLALFWALIGNVCSFTESVFSLERKEGSSRAWGCWEGCDNFSNRCHSPLFLPSESPFGVFICMVCQLQGHSFHTGLPSLEISKQGIEGILLGCQMCGLFLFIVNF